MKKSFPLKTKPSKYYMVTVDFQTEPYFQINRVLFTYNGKPLLYFQFFYKDDVFAIEVNNIDSCWLVARNVKNFINEYTPRLSYESYLEIQKEPERKIEHELSSSNIANDLLHNIWTVIKDGNYFPVNF